MSKEPPCYHGFAHNYNHVVKWDELGGEVVYLYCTSCGDIIEVDDAPDPAPVVNQTFNLKEAA